MTTRAAKAIAWIETYCRPIGDANKLLVRLSADQRETIRQVYDNPDGYEKAAAIADPQLAAYLALIHLVGPGAGGASPALEVSSDMVWAAAGPRLQLELERDVSGAIVCRERGTRFPTAA
jgi:hypothetical protein